MSRKRKNFPKPVQRAALARSGGVCEAVGPLYGHAEHVRCQVKLDKGVNFDHINGDSNGGKPTLENCAATCPRCNQHKNNHTDTPRAAKGLRQQDKHHGITAPKAVIPARPFQSRLKPDKSARIAAGVLKHQQIMDRKRGIA